MARIEAASPSGLTESMLFAERQRELARWMDIGKSALAEADGFVTEAQVRFGGGWVEVRRCSWSRPVESQWATGRRCYLLHMSLDGAGPAHHVTNLKSRSNRPQRMGRVGLVPPGQMMASSAAPGQSRAIRCLLDADLLDEFLDEEPDWNDALLGEAFDVSGGQIEWLMRRMYREVAAPDCATGAMLETLAKQVAVEIVRKFKLRRGAGFSSGGLPPWRLEQLRARLYSDQPLPDLAELAQLCDMTVRHLSRSFRTQTGQTLGKYVEAAMAERATRMLESGVSIGGAAERLGFSGPSGFRSAFRRATGLLPSEVKSRP